MQVISVLWGVVVLLGALVASIPLLGWLNWLNIPAAAVGLALSLVARNRAAPAQRGLATAGLALCAVACGLGVVRLWLGGGFF